MHRVPLSGAIFIEVILVMLALGGDKKEYTINQEIIWTIIVVNFIFIIYAIVRRFAEKNY